MEIKYYKDFRHNYLILKENTLEINGYQSRMITENSIKGLLPCKERHIDGERLLYYDITSRQSLASLYEYTYIDLELVRSMFRQLKLASEAMAGYLLVESSLLLKPEFVFADVEKGDWSFLYFPCETEENYMLSLVEFLTEKMDVEDKDGVEVCYKMLQLIEKEQFVLDEVIQWLEDDYARSSLCRKSRQKEEQPATYGEVPDNFFVEERDYPDEEEQERINENEEKGILAEGREKVAGIIMAVMAIAAGVLYYVYQVNTFTQKGQIYFLAAVAGVVAIFFVSGMYLLICRIFTVSGMKTVPFFGKNRKEETDEKRYRTTEVYEAENIGRKEEADLGNTVFIPWVENCENKLYGMGKGNKNHIDLGRLPLTVGKLAGSVDKVIADQSLSRRHVKFTREGSRICMTDLNSTNGTFLNGLRLEPNTSEMLEPGDEIRLGKLKFIYR